jgi:hypothetical protein
LFEFAKKEWPLNGVDNKKSYIIDHWFFGKYGYNRNAIASLWWSVYCSYDETCKDAFSLIDLDDETPEQPID